ncbi:hypothetical protein AWP77_23310 [Escherichia coli]|nr:hypothetical protein AWP77_23310 [Escherichia coli]OKW55119.1 hypothetical protein AWP76_10490 [Escherichia coli]
MQRHGSIETRTARDKAAERQMSYMDVTQCRPRIIHKAEYLDERKLMCKRRLSTVWQILKFLRE